jgi:uracil-DNA glycosylase
MEVKIEESWKACLSSEFEKPYFQALAEFVREEYRRGTVYPSASLIFKAFELCPFDQVKVVILGQDPYHEPGQAHGLCFSVREGTRHPPSLQNIFKEIASDLGVSVLPSGDLTRWAVQGVLLLNATLTVRAHAAGSHQQQGWEKFTDAVIRRLALRRRQLVYMLWGAYARRKAGYVDPTQNLLLHCPHPSPLSANRGFAGNRHFSQANRYLEATGRTPVDWR